MKPITSSALFLLSILLLPSVATQTLPNPPAQKDAAAVATLTRLLATSGWVKGTIPEDALVTGAITRYRGENSPSTPFTLKIRGDHQYRYSENGSSVALVTNGSSGALVTGDGKLQRLPPHAAMSSRGQLLPMMSIPDGSAADVDVTYVGQSSVQGEAVVGIKLARVPLDSDPLKKVRGLISPVVVWVSTSRGLPVRIDYYRAAIDNYNVTIKEIVMFSDYRTVRGMAVAFRQDIFLGDQHLSTIQFSTVSFGAGLTDADFDVATVAGGSR